MKKLLLLSLPFFLLACNSDDDLASNEDEINIPLIVLSKKITHQHSTNTDLSIVEYYYDQNGRLDSTFTTYASGENGGLHNYIYQDNQIAYIADSNGVPIRVYDYEEDQIVGFHTLSGYSEQYLYNSLNQVYDKKYFNNGEQIDHYTNSYNNNGDIIEAKKVNTPSKITIDYTDTANPLTTVFDNALRQVGVISNFNQAKTYHWENNEVQFERILVYTYNENGYPDQQETYISDNLIRTTSYFYETITP